MLATLSKLVSSQFRPTTALYNDVQHFLQYAATYPEAALTKSSSDMLLVLWSDSSYLPESNSRSRAGGYHYLSKHDDPTTVPIKGAIDIISAILPTVVSAVSEGEFASLFRRYP